jgi:hypothetical protein
LHACVSGTEVWVADSVDTYGLLTALTEALTFVTQHSYAFWVQAMGRKWGTPCMLLMHSEISARQGGESVCMGLHAWCMAAALTLP